MSEFLLLLKQRYNINPTLLLTIGLIIMIVALITTCIVFSLGNILSENKHLQTISGITATMIDGETIENYYNTKQEDEYYQTMLRVLRRIRDRSNISYIYIAKFEQDGAHFIFDSDEKEHMKLGGVMSWERLFGNITNYEKQQLINGEIVPTRHYKNIVGEFITVYSRIELEKENRVLPGFYVVVDVLMD
jgi:lipopolysaccharide export LptBFGC system permease protein LptF